VRGAIAKALHENKSLIYIRTSGVKSVISKVGNEVLRKYNLWLVSGG